jgi:hypothetical protein
MCELDPTQDIKLFFVSWRNLQSESSLKLSAEINNFIDDLSSKEKAMDTKAQEVSDVFFPRMEEVNAEGLTYLKCTFGNNIACLLNSRKSSEISEGKLAGISLHSQEKRNSFILSKAVDFATICLLIRQRFIDFDLSVVESDTVLQLKDTYLKYESIQTKLKSDFKAEIKIIKCETKEKDIMKKTKAAREIYKEISESKYC